MEEILLKLQKDASGHKHKAIRDACVYARGECAAAPSGSGPPACGSLPRHLFKVVWYLGWRVSVSSSSSGAAAPAAEQDTRISCTLTYT